jgi:hypothetical protein
MSHETSNTQNQNARLAFKLVVLVVGIFLVTLWKFRPV